jgi:hypothetical protein
MDRQNINPEDLKFRHPFNLIVSGGSGSGKTEWVTKLLSSRETMINSKMEDILYCYGVYDKKVLELEGLGIYTFQGLPNEEMLKSLNKPALVVLDDLMIEAKEEYLDLLFSRGSHHWNISLIFITQNLFTKSIKTARNNAHYIVLLRNRAGELQVRNLGIQLFPRKGEFRYFMEAYKNATETNFSYILIDLHSASNELLKLRTNIFPNEKPYIIYLPK